MVTDEIILGIAVMRLQKLTKYGPHFSGTSLPLSG
jgi:hypothetical protein